MAAPLPRTPGARLRIGAVTYLNTVPLVRGLAELLPGARLSFDHPSRLADDLAGGRLDLALAPVIELARHPDWAMVSNACIAARGPVLSVKLLFRRRPAEVQTLAIDQGSRTSAVLARILLADIHAVHPRVVQLGVDEAPHACPADAVLVIGDRAIRTPETGFIESWDLADRWRRWTELPFVFAVWAARPGVDVAGVGGALEAARDAGRRDLPQIAAEQSAAMGLPLELVLAYLRDHLHFHFGSDERRGLELYFERAAALGLTTADHAAATGPTNELALR
ncbi:MAG TPA: menaquinone biosynthesis protein [Lacipirellulaceae bacterium]|nr:menaquinone biosynthesis protein [Lacipirellulaceae bacterium]